MAATRRQPGKRERCRAILRALPEAAIPGYLIEHSGLPGPRADLELLAAFGDVASAALIRRLAEDEDEYLRSCGTAALGRLLLAAPDDEDVRSLLAERATDASWRVREAVAMAGQRIGDDDPAQMLALVETWAGSEDPLTVRAAIATVCEPRLLRDSESTTAALRTCQVATDFLAALPAARRREPDVRTLRQALGYCWSVAVAADPAAGLPAFDALTGSADPDVGWVVRENRKKRRLQVLL